METFFKTLGLTFKVLFAILGVLFNVAVFFLRIFTSIIFGILSFI